MFILSVKEERKIRNPQLEYEAQIYRIIEGGCKQFLEIKYLVGIPRVHCFLQEGDFNIMVMQELGPSLEALHVFCGRRFS